jgi:hypothetical protein
MKLEYDSATEESVIKTDLDGVATLIFAIDMALMGNLTTKNQNELRAVREALTTTVEPDTFTQRMHNYWENPR